MDHDPRFVERRPDGRFAVLKGDADKAIALCNTQGAAIDRAHEITDGEVVAARVRYTKVGKPDHWRKA